MLNKHSVIFVISLVFVSSVIANDTDTKNTFLVETSALECVLSVIDEFLALEKDPVLVFFDLCPKVQPSTNEILKNATNSLPGIKKAEVPHGESVVRIIALSREEIMCLSQMASDRTFPKSRQLQGTKIFVTKVSFENCKSSKQKKSTSRVLQ